MPSADDPRFGPGGAYAAKPGGSSYVAPPQLTLEAAQAFAAYDKARQATQAQTWTNTGNTTGRALEPWQTEDRIAYNTAQAERSKQMQQQAELQRTAQFRAMQNASNFVNRTTNTARTVATAADQAAEYHSPFRAPGQDYTPVEGTAGVAGNVASKIGDIANQSIPYSDVLARTAGSAVGQLAKVMPQTAGANFLTEHTPLGNIGGKDTTTSNLLATGAETLVPQHVWEAALALIPAYKARTIPELIGAITVGDTDAFTALKNAGKRLGENEKVDAFLGKLGSEAGFAKLGPEGEKAAAGAGDAAGGLPAAAADNLPLPPKPGGSLEERLARPANTNSALTPPEHQELISALREIMPTTSEKQAELAAGRARQFGDRTTAIKQALAEGKSNQEALAAGKKAMAGDILTRKNLIGVFTDERVDGYYGDIVSAELSSQITKGESIAAHNGMDLLTKGVRSNGNHGPIMKHEADAMARVFGPEIIAALPTSPMKMTAFQKIFAPVQIYRSWKTGFDDSFGFGQGWKIMFSDRGAWAKGKLAGWKAALGDEASAESIMETLRANSPTFIRGQSTERPLAIMTTGAGTNPAEEFMSPVTRLLPGLSRSERSFVVGGSVMRQLALDRKAALWEAANPGKAVPDDVFQRMVDMVNEGTNWGHLSEKLLGDWKGPASQMLFSAHAKAALFQYPITLTKAMAPGADPTLRKMAAGDFASWILGNAAVLGAGTGSAALAASLGFQVPGGTGAQLNPFGKNFGQIKFGPQRFDIWQGASPLVRFVIQSALAGSKGDWKAPGKLGLNYGRSQLSPSFQIPTDYVVGGGKSVTGQGQDEKGYWANAASPLFISDTVDSMRELGFPLGIPGAVASFEGSRVNTYSNSASQDETAAKTDAAAPLGDTDFNDIVPDSWKDSLDSITKAIPVSDIGKPASEFGSLAELKKAYLEPEPGEHPTKTQIDKRGTQFDNLPAIVDYKNMIKKREVYELKKLPVEKRQAAYDAGVVDLDKDQRAALGIK